VRAAPGVFKLSLVVHVGAESRNKVGLSFEVGAGEREQGVWAPCLQHDAYPFLGEPLNPRHAGDLFNETLWIMRPCI
jgi:hypothetical protein